MARSAYIYAVMRDGGLVAAFTVKYECLHWVGMLPPDARHGVDVFRVRDGAWGDSAPVKLDLGHDLHAECNPHMACKRSGVPG